MQIEKHLMSKRVQDLTGKKFGRLTVIKYLGSDTKWRESQWLCSCECGNVTVVTSRRLNKGITKSCGCLVGELASSRFTTHGLSTTRIYNIWKEMRDRCYNKKSSGYYLYGDRGIKICDEWLIKGPNGENDGFKKFNDWAINNGYADNLTIDRIDPNKNYCPENCRWISGKTQSNNRRNNHYIRLNLGLKEFIYTISEWAEISKIPHSTIRSRLRIGWSEFDAIFTPVNSKPGEKVIIPVITPEMEERNHLNYINIDKTNHKNTASTISQNDRVCRIHLIINRR